MHGEVSIANIVLELGRDRLLPAIVFRSARRQCDIDAERAGRNRQLHLPPTEQRAIRQRINELAKSYEMDVDLLQTHPQYNALVLTGVGAHHAGQLLMWRLLLEELMSAGLLRALVATGTVAAGVDFPARTVVITAHSRRGAEGFKPLTAAEFQQMSGRAGRRGKDAVGFCVAAPSQFCDARALFEISKQPPEPLASAYFPGPSTVLNLLRYQNVDGLRYTVERSLASFADRKAALKAREAALSLEESLLAAGAAEEEDQGAVRERKRLQKKARRLKRQADELERRQIVLLEKSLGGLEELGYLVGETLSDKGYWAANLCTSLVLELGEVVEAELVKDSTVEELVAVVASLCGDPHRKYLSGKELPLSKEQFGEIARTIERVSTKGMPGVLESRVVLPAGAFTVVKWLWSNSWQEFRGLLLLAGVAEGDAARLITQTAEQLNQLVRLSDSHPLLAAQAEEAKQRILRPPLTEAINLEM